MPFALETLILNKVFSPFANPNKLYKVHKVEQFEAALENDKDNVLF